MKYAKPIFFSILIYIAFYLIKVFVVNSLVDEFSPTNPAIKLGLDCLWLVTTIYVWRMLTKSKVDESKEEQSEEPNEKT